ncbi:hypothetical protein [Alteromonas oceanisediminis]|uniref:hypothetical protein n=1 Tax=Alteromonas oceanisediminis TaxID=2836180 RepID=UPI001BDAC131|nr:hypothetical protein [Alteromonas oceanisediminis]MBT0586658.1 hypothetical protein [Alteromonas oceanisediminis]
MRYTRIGYAIGLLSLLFFLNQAHASKQCLQADPTSASDVFECISTATMNSHNATNPFGMLPKTQCNLLQETYRNVLRKNGLNAEESAENIPDCRVLAQALVKLNGEPPVWSSCLNYDGTATHMLTCLTTTLKTTSNRRATASLSNCAAANMLYELMLRSVSEPQRMGELPDNYEQISCDAFLGQLTEMDENVDELPCAGFSRETINSHAKQCLMSEPRLQNASIKPTCQMLRQVYQAKLITVYGKVPEGYRLLPCSVLNPIADELQVQKSTSAN